MSKLKFSGKNTTGTYNIGTGFNNVVNCIVEEPYSGKTYIGGYFTTYNGLSQNNLIRLNTDGSKDTSFDIGSGFDGGVFSVAVDIDGKIYVGGWFQNYSGTTIGWGLIKLNQNGTIDTTFNTNDGFNNVIYDMVLNSDRKLYAVGTFKRYYDGTYQYYLIRLNSDGTKDTEFNIGTAPWLNGFNEGGNLNNIELDADQKIFVSGVVASYNGISIRGFIKFNTNGTVDTSFIPDLGPELPYQGANIIELNSDGKLYVGGDASERFGPTQGFLIRLNTNGSYDTSFDGGIRYNNAVSHIELDSDQKLLVSGTFTEFSGLTQSQLVRLNTNGAKDYSFNVDRGFMNSFGYTDIFCITNISDKIYIGGDFETYKGIPQKYYIRLNSDGSSDMYRTIKSSLGIKGSSNTAQVLNFNNDVFVDFPTELVLSGLIEPISFYMYLDSSNYSTIAMLIYSCDISEINTHNQLIVYLNNNYLYVQVGSGVNEAKRIDITSYVNQTVFVQIKRIDNYQTADINYVKFNGLEQTLNSTEQFISIVQQFNVGTLYNTNIMQYFYRLYDATIWNITISERNHYNGYVGNMDSGWLDTIGSNNGSISGTTKTTRKVTVPVKKKLKLVPLIDTTFKLEITTTNPNQEITIPHLSYYNYNYMVDYGDGTILSVISYNDMNCTHIYVNPGVYILKIVGICESIYVNFSGTILLTITKVLSWGNVGLKNINFFGCSNLTEIPTDTIGGLSLIESLYNAFNATAITSIPSSLLDYCTVNTDFNGTFNYLNISSIPSKLFDNCVSGQDFTNTFGGATMTTIPSGLFSNCISARNFNGTFTYCSSLQTIPSGLFSGLTNVTSFSGTFGYCSSLETIPSDIFSGCTNATNFYGTFQSCSLLSSIPSNLFTNLTAITDFSYVFNYCTNLTTISSNLFSGCTNALYFIYSFAYCSSLQTIPSTMFGGCVNADRFDLCFDECTGLTAIPATLFSECPNVTNFFGTFEHDISLTGNAPTLWITYPTATGEACFRFCTVDNYNSIPGTWK